jgi:hypothetical protein
MRSTIARYAGGLFIAAGSVGLLGAGYAYLNVHNQHTECIANSTLAACRPGYTYKQAIRRVENFAIGSASLAAIGAMTIILFGGNPEDRGSGNGPGPENAPVIDMDPARGHELDQTPGRNEEAAA